ncbi:hypothetical protein JZ751_007657 [Albula glossodonta]|uniref:Aconitase/3-isopropylmalate dehydratase large subunit alpha/beta/alpha domain-containing protein n=1 Tax=Albula glossodonta TaxID=121402 RepID=A0A8T2N1U3_9TELE|nr:hypothetical protein JZ751_007657 [Albula glossodonta]
MTRDRTSAVMSNPYARIVEPLDPQKPGHKFYNLSKLQDHRYGRCGTHPQLEGDTEPGGVPAVVDFAAMRDAVKALGGDPENINPVCPADLVIDHSIQWGSKAFRNMRIIPPGSGIVHQVNLEYLARVVFDQDGFYYPDSLVGTDSHTTMIDGLGVLGWGVGGIEAEAVMLGQPISMVLPEVIGYRVLGTPDKLVTSTDIVLTVTKHLREVGVVGKFVEFFGPGVAQLSIADRATIANMCPEYGATAAFFPVDHISIKYLEQTGRDPEKLSYISQYLKAVGMFRDYNDISQDPDFTKVPLCLLLLCIIFRGVQ